jgi:hypothetical protein
MGTNTGTKLESQLDVEGWASAGVARTHAIPTALRVEWISGTASYVLGLPFRSTEKFRDIRVLPWMRAKFTHAECTKEAVAWSAISAKKTWIDQ